jgi:hypothetical protein
MSGNGNSIRDEYASFLVQNDASLLQKTLHAVALDSRALQCVMRSEEGSRVFREPYSAIEGARDPARAPSAPASSFHPLPSPLQVC